MVTPPLCALAQVEDDSHPLGSMAPARYTRLGNRCMAVFDHSRLKKKHSTAQNPLRETALCVNIQKKCANLQLNAGKVVSCEH